MFSEFLIFAAKVLIVGLLLAPIVGGVGFSLITNWYKEKLNFQKNLVLMQIEMAKKMAESGKK